MTKILLIEDEPGIQETIQITLESEGFSVSVASTGKQGIQKVSNDTSLIVLDIGLPDQNGFEVLKEIRKSFQTPVIFLTARNTEIDKVLGLEMGADDYIVKPFSPRELLARIRAILRRTTQLQPMEDHKFRISLDKKLVYLNGKILNLSPYEYKTMELFLNGPDVFLPEKKLWTVCGQNQKIVSTALWIQSSKTSVLGSKKLKMTSTPLKQEGDRVMD